MLDKGNKFQKGNKLGGQSTSWCDRLVTKQPGWDEALRAEDSSNHMLAYYRLIPNSIFIHTIGHIYTRIPEERRSSAGGTRTEPGVGGGVGGERSSVSGAAGRLPQTRGHCPGGGSGAPSLAGSVESGERVDLDRVLEGRPEAGVRYADPHLQVHLVWVVQDHQLGHLS